MTFINTISPTIKYTFTSSEQTVTFLDLQIYLSETRKLKTKLNRKPMDCMILLHFHSHHPLSCKEGIIYSQALRYNMTISEDHTLQEKLSNLTRILLARAYPLHLIIKNIKSLDLQTQSPVILTNTADRNILPIVTPFSDISKLLAAVMHGNWHSVANDTIFSTIFPSIFLSAYTKSSGIYNRLVHSAQTYGSLRQDS